MSIRRILPASDRAVLVELDDLESTMALFTALDAAPPAGVRELVPAASTILVHVDTGASSLASVAAAIRAVRPAAIDAAASTAVTIPVRYDGQDLDEVAELLGIPAAEVASRHAAAAWRVAFTGYAPGFAYLVGDDPIFEVPRRASPRTRIPAGSVGLAGSFSGVYPRESPGGWQLIGRTDAVMWSLDREPPALLAPGTPVRFERVERELVIAAPSAPVDVDAPAAILVERAGMQLVVQDAGRHGHAKLGVSASGAADRSAMRTANRAVGNEPSAAVLELAGGGALLRCRGAAVLATSGADAPLTIHAGGARIPARAERAIALDDGDALEIGGVGDGLRVCIASRGGIALDPQLGSRATDTLAGIGPAPLRVGDVVPLAGLASATAATEHVRAPRNALPRSGDVVDLDIVLGPRADWFTADAIDTLTRQAWLVTPRSDRVGIRLEGREPLERAIEGELPSEGAVTGAIQVPPDGQPVLFLPDHPLTGGYPIIGAVADHHLDLAGQLPPGARIRFRPVADFAEL